MFFCLFLCFPENSVFSYRKYRQIPKFRENTGINLKKQSLLRSTLTLVATMPGGGISCLPLPQIASLRTRTRTVVFGIVRSQEEGATTKVLLQERPVMVLASCGWILSCVHPKRNQFGATGTIVECRRTYRRGGRIISLLLSAEKQTPLHRGAQYRMCCENVYSSVDLHPDRLYLGVSLTTSLSFISAHHCQRTRHQRQSRPVICTQTYYSSHNIPYYSGNIV